MPRKHWEPGNNAYRDFLATLTPEERKEHFALREKKKAMKKAMEAVVMEQQSKWISELNNAAAVLLKQCIEEGDHKAFVAVWDRIIGKPTNEVKVDTSVPLAWSDDFDDDIGDVE